MEGHRRHVSCGALCSTKEFDLMGSEYYKAVIAYTNLTSWPSVQENPACVQKIFHVRYWKSMSKESKKESDHKEVWIFLAVSGVLVVIIAIFFLILYFKKWRTKGSEGQQEESKSQAENFETSEQYVT